MFRIYLNFCNLTLGFIYFYKLGNLKMDMAQLCLKF